MIHLQRNLFNPIVVLRLYNVLLQLRLRDLCAQHHQIQHQQQFEQRSVRNVEMSNGFESQIAFFLFDQFVWRFFDQFHTDL